MSSDLDAPVGAQAQLIAKLASRGWVTMPQMARLAGIDYHTVRDHYKKGRLQAILVGGQYRVYEDEIIRYLTGGNYIGPHTFEALKEFNK